MERWLWLAVLAVACGGGEDGRAGAAGAGGATGPMGPMGPAGEPGEDGGSYAWFDAEGTRVTEGAELLYWDEGGNAWGVDAETAELFAPGVVEAVMYSDDWCELSGNTRVPALVPRFVHEVAGEAAAEVLSGQFVVRPDDLSSEEFCWTSMRDSTTDLNECYIVNDGECPAAVNPNDLVVVQMPAATWASPLHPEPIGQP